MEEMSEESRKETLKRYEEQFKDKGRMVTFRLTHDEIDKMDEKATLAGLTRTELLKRWIDE